VILFLWLLWGGFGRALVPSRPTCQLQT